MHVNWCYFRWIRKNIYIHVMSSLTQNKCGIKCESKWDRDKKTHTTTTTATKLSGNTANWCTRDMCVLLYFWTHIFASILALCTEYFHTSSTQPSTPQLSDIFFSVLHIHLCSAIIFLFLGWSLPIKLHKKLASKSSKSIFLSIATLIHNANFGMASTE